MNLLDQDTVLQMVYDLEETDSDRCVRCRARINLKSFRLTSREHDGNEGGEDITWITGVIVCHECAYRNIYRIIAYPDDRTIIRWSAKVE